METTAQSGERREEGSNCQADAWTASAFILSLTQVHAQLEDSIIAVRTYCTLKVHCLQGISGKFYSNPTIILINTHYIKRRQPEFVDLKMIHSCVTYCVHTCKKQSSCLKSCTTQMAPPTYIHTYICTYNIHKYVPWISRCVTKTAGCGLSHKYANMN